MPIHNLTVNPQKAFMKLGHIRKGEKKTVKRADGSTYDKPVDLDHFRVTFQPGKLSDDLQAEFIKAYGSAPTEINVRFANANPDQVWDANYECYRQGGLIAKAGTRDTGPYWIFYRNPDTAEVLVRDGAAVGMAGKEFMEKPIDLDAPIYYNSKNEPVRMSPVGRLQVVIPELAHIAVGFFTFQPVSVRDIRNISAELSAFDAIAKSTGHSITGIPFRLIRRLEEITKNINGKLSKGPSWVVHLDAGGDWGRRAISAIEQLALPDVVEAEYADVEETPIPDAGADMYPPDTVNAPLMISAPVTEPAPAGSTDEMIDPYSQKAVKWAAMQWNNATSTAAKEIGKLEQAGKITNPMSKKAFQDAIKATV